MSIELEKDKSTNYTLTMDKTNDKLVELTLDNVARVEAMIYTDSSYSRSGDKEAEPKGKDFKGFKGSSAYWFNKLKRELNDRLNDDNKLYHVDDNEEIIFNLVSAIDSENSTHLNAHKKGYCGIEGRKEISQRITEITKGDFINYLSSPTSSNFKLYKIIAAETKAERKNPSFASKFCHYSCMYLFDENDERRDNYSIYDGILREVIPYYADRYDVILTDEYNNAINNKDINVYPLYWNIVGNIIENASRETGNKISRNGFDHILWYYHKGRMYKLK